MPLQSLTQKMKIKANIYYLLFISAIFLCACTFNKKERVDGVDYLQGKWSEDSVENKNQLVSYQQYHITFTCDSFYLNIQTHSTVNLNGGACYDTKEWQEFAKGYYTLANDTLKLEGNFVNKTYKYKPEGSCYRVGKYEENFILNKQADGLIHIKSLQKGLVHQLVRKEKLVCISDLKN
jgi:hypothetical protein